MKELAFAAVSAVALVSAGAAAAQGVALFGDARLGLGYNIDNDGGILVDDNGEVPDDLRAVSRVRFGVNMTGETDSGIVFGASIRADNAEGGEGGTEGQFEGDVFVSGNFGTLTYGDTDGADYHWVGDVPGDFSLTGLGDLDETRFVSDGGDFGTDSGASFLPNPSALPTVRYDFDLAGFGISLSSNRDLTDVGVGAGYASEFGGGSWSAGVGYYDFASFTTEPGEPTFSCTDANADGICEEVIETAIPGETIPAGHQWSAGLLADYDVIALGMTYTLLDTDRDPATGAKYRAGNLLLGAAFAWDAWSVGLVYGKILDASGALESIDGQDSYEVSAQYDLGGGASINGGIRRTYGLFDADGNEVDSAYIGDFGVMMNF
jgi:outer membrane protein OmpU